MSDLVPTERPRLVSGSVRLPPSRCIRGVCPWTVREYTVLDEPLKPCYDLVDYEGKTGHCVERERVEPRWRRPDAR